MDVKSGLKSLVLFYSTIKKRKLTVGKAGYKRVYSFTQDKKVTKDEAV
ncbi:hypothetical protein C5S42_06865, partial [Candidatus Methanomarinus sp.]